MRSKWIWIFRGYEWRSYWIWISVGYEWRSQQTWISVENMDGCHSRYGFQQRIWIEIIADMDFSRGYG